MYSLLKSQMEYPRINNIEWKILTKFLLKNFGNFLLNLFDQISTEFLTKFWQIFSEFLLLKFSTTFLASVFIHQVAQFDKTFYIFNLWMFVIRYSICP
jgi:hypothetical protein